MNSYLNENKGKKEWFVPIIVLLIVSILWLLSLFFLYDRPQRGTFGDMFGAVNALFSGFAFVGIIYAILLQRKELKLQRIELEQTRKELEGQKIQLEKQNQTLRKQNFENTFFQLLSVHNEIINKLELEPLVKGRLCFLHIYDYLKDLWDVHYKRRDNIDEIKKINEAYLGIFKKREEHLGHYFRNLYNIIKFVDISDIDNKKFYTNIIRAQLSSYELALLFYNCLSDMGNEKFKPLIEKYSLLKTLSNNLLLDITHSGYYIQSAYM